MAIKRYDEGFSGVASSAIDGAFPHGQKLLYHEFFDDFNTYIPGGAGAGVWTLTESSGTNSQQLLDEDGGVMQLLNHTTDDIYTQMQLVNESFLLESGKKFWMASRFAVNNAIQTDLLVGLTTEQTTTNFFTGGAFVYDDGVAFRKLDGTAVLSYATTKSDVSDEQSGILTLANNTYVTVGIYYDGDTTVKVFNTMSNVAFSTTTSLPATWPDDAELAPCFYIQNGTTGAMALSIDYFWCAKER